MGKTPPLQLFRSCLNYFWIIKIPYIYIKIYLLCIGCDVLFLNLLQKLNAMAVTFSRNCLIERGYFLTSHLCDNHNKIINTCITFTLQFDLFFYRYLFDKQNIYRYFLLFFFYFLFFFIIYHTENFNAQQWVTVYRVISPPAVKCLPFYMYTC